MKTPLIQLITKYRLALLALSMTSHLWAGNEPPVHDSIRVSAAVLVKGESAEAPVFSGEWTKVGSKKLPESIAVYLKPSKVIDSRSEGVKKAAGQVLRLMGAGGAKQAQEDPRLLAEAVRVWVALNFFPPDDDYEPRPYATDTRTLLPKASRLIKIQQADQPGKVRVRLALLRALGVPARAARLRGIPAVQYWAQWISDEPEKSTPPKSKKTKEAPKVKGEWVTDETLFPGETVEAWALDAGDLAPALWLPEQELAHESTLERAYFSLSETAKATEALEQIRQCGRMPLSLTARVLPPRKGPWLMLANHRARFYTEGSMEALSPLELLLPYRPKLASWGSQQRPIPESLETLATAFWCDRPDRARIKKGGEWTDEYKSPPPAYGVLHYASINLRKPAQVLEARLEGEHVIGKLLRRDSLAIRSGWDITVEFLGGKPRETMKGKTDAQGNFDVEVPDLRSSFIKVSGGQGNFDLSRWDSLLLEGYPNP